MRLQAPLIIGAGPAGCTAAIALARAGHYPLLIDRDEQPGDAICGGFLSWHTIGRLRQLGIDPYRMGAHIVRELRVYAGKAEARVILPGPACGLSRRALDTALRNLAMEEGVELVVDTIRKIEGYIVYGETRQWHREALFLASGKHDVRGQPRLRNDKDPALGLRIRIAADRSLEALLQGAIELHLFQHGYAGIVLQEDGSANICMAVRKSRLTEAGGDPRKLFAMLAEEVPAFARRLSGDWRMQGVDTIGAVPYGWIARRGTPGIFRLGDQAGVIPSLAGEGIDIALASGAMAAHYWIEGGAVGSMDFQPDFAARLGRPIRYARLARAMAEVRAGHLGSVWLARTLPGMVVHLMNLTRI